MTRMAHVDKNRFGPWAVVTGASSGIGKEFARQLATNRINVVLVARRLALLEILGQELAAEFGVDYRVVGLDLSEENFLEALVPVTRVLDIGFLVSNAGTGLPRAFLDIPAEDLVQAVRLNVVAHLTPDTPLRPAFGAAQTWRDHPRIGDGSVTGHPLHGERLGHQSLRVDPWRNPQCGT